MLLPARVSPLDHVDFALGELRLGMRMLLNGLPILSFESVLVLPDVHCRGQIITEVFQFV